MQIVNQETLVSHADKISCPNLHRDPQCCCLHPSGERASLGTGMLIHWDTSTSINLSWNSCWSNLSRHAEFKILYCSFHPSLAERDFSPALHNATHPKDMQCPMLLGTESDSLDLTGLGRWQHIDGPPHWRLKRKSILHA